MIHRIRECVQFVRVPVCYQLSRTTGCPRFWTKFSGSSRSGFSPLFTPWLPSAQTIPTHQFSSSATTGMGENSSTTYTLQGSLKIWVNFHPGCIPRQIWMFFIFVFFCISQTYSVFSKHNRKKVVDSVMKFLFHNSNNYSFF